MGSVRRLALVRHGETEGNSSTRFFGSTDVSLSGEGRLQMSKVAMTFRDARTDLVVASPLRRSWEGAQIVSGGSQIRLIDGFREVDFGRWEGFTSEEIEATDPTRYAEWKSKSENFMYPGGEGRREFKNRVKAALEKLLTEQASNVLLVLHKGVIRIIIETLTNEPSPEDHPKLGELISLTRRGEGGWFKGTQSSNPTGLD